MTSDPRVSPDVAAWTAYGLHLVVSGLGGQQAPDPIKPELAAWRLFWTQVAASGQEWPSEQETPPGADDPPVLLTYKQAGNVLNISERMIRRLADEGQLQAVRIGRAVRIHRDDLDAYAQQLRTAKEAA